MRESQEHTIGRREGARTIQAGELFSPSTVLGAEADKIAAQARALERSSQNAVVAGSFAELNAQAARRDARIAALRTEEGTLRELTAGLIKGTPDAQKRANEYFDQRSEKSAAQLRATTELIAQGEKDKTPEYQAYAGWQGLLDSASTLAESARKNSEPSAAQESAVAGIKLAMSETKYGKILAEQARISKELKTFQDISAQLEGENQGLK